MNRRSEKIFTPPFCAYLCGLMLGAWWISPSLKALVVQPQATIDDLTSPDFQNDPNNLIQREPLPPASPFLPPTGHTADAHGSTFSPSKLASSEAGAATNQVFLPPPPRDLGGSPGPLSAPPDLSFFISLAPSKRASLHGVEYRTNHAGFRDNEEYSTEINPEEQRIAFVGDSFTFGWGVKHQDTIPALVRTIGSRLERRWRIFNFGIPAYNLRDVTLFLYYRALNFKPNKIVYLLHLNDGFARSASNLGAGTKTNELVLSYLLGRSRNGEEERMVSEFLNATAPQFVSNVLTAWGFPSLKEARKDQFFIELFLEYFTTLDLPVFWGDFLQSLTYLRDLSEFVKAKVIVALVPAIDFPWTRYPFNPLHEKIERECKNLGFTVINLKPLLERYPNKELMLWGYDGHTSAFANKLIAEKIAAELQKISH